MGAWDTHYRMPPYVAGGATLLLDAYPSAAFAYSFRKLRTAYAGSAVRIRASGDSAESDFGFTGNDFDSAGVASFLTTHGGSGFITTWYDQSGNGLDVTQATAANQPLYQATGLASKPTMDLTAASVQFLQRASFTSANFGTGTQFTMMSVMMPDDNASGCSLLSWETGGAAGTHLQLWTPYSDSSLYLDFGSGSGTGRVSVAIPGGFMDNPHVYECYRDSSDNQAIVDNGTSLVSATRTDDIPGATSDTLFIGVYNSGAEKYDGAISELVFWGTDLGGSRSGARTNINTYYSVF